MDPAVPNFESSDNKKRQERTGTPKLGELKGAGEQEEHQDGPRQGVGCMYETRFRIGIVDIYILPLETDVLKAQVRVDIPIDISILLGVS